MQILVLGGDGYLGWPTALHLSALGHEVAVNDNFARRGYDEEMGVESLVPIATLDERIAAWAEVGGKTIKSYVGDLCDAAFVHNMVSDFRPDTIVHFGEQRAAPYSMIDQAHCVYTQTNNIVGNLNVMYAIADIDIDIHLVKLGTMGEYGTPNIDIEEGWLEVEHNGRKDRVLYPKRPGSFYHLSKVHDSHNIEFGCRIWGMRATDLNQGVVYGADTEQTKLDPRLATRFDYDGVFGTVLNRMVIQAVLGHPLTVYGNGSQTRGLINIVDTVECIRLASETPAERGEFRVFNQFTEHLSVRQIAETIAEEFPGEATIEHGREPARRGRGPLLQRQAHRARRPRAEADAAVDDADRPPVRRRRAPQGPRRPGGDHADRELAVDDQRSAPDVDRRAGPDVSERRVLVTGGSGFIGRHAVAELTRAGAHVRVVDLKPHPDPAVEIVVGDIGDPDTLEAAFAGGIDSVVHLAAVTSVLRSVEQSGRNVRHERRGHACVARGRAGRRHDLARVRLDQRGHRADGRSRDRRVRDAAAAHALRRHQGGGRDADVRLHRLLRRCGASTCD